MKKQVKEFLDKSSNYAVIEYITNLQQENKQLKEDIIKILNKNCDDLEATEEEFDSLDRWQDLQVVVLEQGIVSNE